MYIYTFVSVVYVYILAVEYISIVCEVSCMHVFSIY